MAVIEMGVAFSSNQNLISCEIDGNYGTGCWVLIVVGCELLELNRKRVKIVLRDLKTKQTNPKQRPTFK